MRKIGVLSFILSLLIISCNKSDKIKLNKSDSLVIEKITESDSVDISYNVKGISIILYNSQVINDRERLLFSPIIAKVTNDLVIKKLNIIDSKFMILVKYHTRLDENLYKYSLKKIINFERCIDKLSEITSLINQNDSFNIKHYFLNEKVFNSFKKNLDFQNNKTTRDISGFESTLGSNKKIYISIRNTTKKQIYITFDDEYKVINVGNGLDD